MNAKFEKKYGQFIVDFANADSTENAVLACFTSLQRLFGFSAEFYDMVKNLYPSINSIAVLLTEVDKKLLEQILKKNAIIRRLNEQFKSINYAIENYDPISSTVSLMSLEWNRDSNGGLTEDNQIDHDDPGGSGFLETLKLLGLSIVDGPVTIKMDAVQGEIEALLGSLAVDQLNRLIEVGHDIADLLADLDGDRYEELRLLAEEHREVIDFHHEIEDIQTDLRQILEMVIQGKTLNQIPALTVHLDTYNTAGAHRLIIGENNCLLTISPINEHNYLAIKEVDGWLDVLRKDMAYSLIEFLKSKKSRGYLKKCRVCRKYFLARQPK